MYVVLVHFEIDPDYSDEFKQAVQKQAQHSLSREEDCLQFDVCVSPTDPASFLLYEIYTNEEAFQHHAKTNHFKSFSEHTREWVKNKTISFWNKLL